MLEKQRDKKKPVLECRIFARKFLLLHLSAGLVMTALLLFHELFFVSIGVFLWYLISVGLAAGMMTSHEWCRPLLAAMFLLLAVSAAVFITNIHSPMMKIDHSPMLSRDGLPLWGALATIGYFVGSMMMFFSRRLHRATLLGFGLW